MLKSNVVIITGNLAGEPKKTQVSEKNSVVRFTIGHNHDSENASFFTVEAWNGLGDACAELPVGTLVEVRGKLQQDRWQTSDGENKSLIKVKASEVDFVKYPAQQA